MIDLPHRKGTSRIWGDRAFLCSKCRKNTVTDCPGQRDLDQKYDGRIVCFDCRTDELLHDEPNRAPVSSEETP